MPDRSPGAYRGFPTTHWSLIQRAADEDREALAELLTLYLPVLESYLVFIRGVDVHEAEDLVAGFMTEKVLERDLLARAKEDRGKFRTLLLSSLRNYSIDLIKKKKLQYSRIDVGCLESEDSDRDLDAVETAFASRIIQDALQLAEAHAKEDHLELAWEVFERKVLDPTFRSRKAEAYESIVGRLELKSPREAANKLTTAKRVFVRCLREVVNRYVRGSKGDIDDEIRALKVILEKPRVRRRAASERKVTSRES